MPLLLSVNLQFKIYKIKPIFLPKAAADKNEMSEMLNHTRLIPEILKHTSQLNTLWAQLRNMTDKLDSIQGKLDNCSFGAANGHVTLPPPTSPTKPTPG